MPRLPPAVPLVLLLAVPAVLRAQPVQSGTPTATMATQPPPSATAVPLSMMDGNFLGQALAANQAELDFGKIAQARTANADVRDFGGKLSADGAQLDRELETLAQQQGIQVPASFSQQQQLTATRLQSAPDDRFDRDYLAAVVGSEQQAVDQYRQEIRASSDAAVKRYAQRALPMLQSHLDRARQLQARLP